MRGEMRQRGKGQNERHTGNIDAAGQADCVKYTRGNMMLMPTCKTCRPYCLCSSLSPNKLHYRNCTTTNDHATLQANTIAMLKCRQLAEESVAKSPLDLPGNLFVCFWQNAKQQGKVLWTADSHSQNKSLCPNMSSVLPPTPAVIQTKKQSDDTWYATQSSLVQNSTHKNPAAFRQHAFVAVNAQ